MSNIIINLHHARFLLTSRNESTSITTFGRASWPYATGVVFAPHCIRMEHKRSTNIGKISYRVMDQKFVFLRFSISLWTERLGRTQDHNSSWRSWHDWRIHVITGESIALALKELSAGVKFSSSSMLTNNDVVTNVRPVYNSSNISRTSVVWSRPSRDSYKRTSQVGLRRLFGQTLQQRATIERCRNGSRNIGS